MKPNKLKLNNKQDHLTLVDVFTTNKKLVEQWFQVAQIALDSAEKQEKGVKFFRNCRDLLSSVLNLRWDSNGYITIDDGDDLLTYHITSLWEIDMSELKFHFDELSDICNNLIESDPQKGVKKSLMHLHRVILSLREFAEKMP